MRQGVMLALALCLGVTAAGQAAAQAAPTGRSETARSIDSIPKPKRTAAGLYLTPMEAADIVRKDGSHTLFVDVRTRGEMMFTGWAPLVDGHVPFVDVTEFWDWDDREGRYKLEPNGSFTAQVERLLETKGLAKTDRVILMCRSGDRSARAADKLTEMGFTQVYSQYEGFEGDLSPYGQRTVNGWKNAGLPWTYKPDRAKFYAGGL